jgi:hypothetical protein
MPRTANLPSLLVQSFAAESRQIELDEDESRAIVRRVLGLPDERAVNREANAARRLRMLAELNASNECLRRYRAAIGPNAWAVFKAVSELGHQSHGTLTS